jgi:ribosomal subunit interface protein
MDINIKGLSLDLTPAMKDYTQKKIDMLQRYLGAIKVINCDVDLALTTHHHNKGEIFKIVVNLELPGTMLRVEKTEKDIYKAIDKAKDHLKDSITKYKEKMIGKKRKTI